MSVNKVNMRRWIDDLRTTGALQVQGQLTDGIGYCCLGRACELARQDGVVFMRGVDEFRYVSAINDRDNSAGMLPLAVAEWLGGIGTDPVIAVLNNGVDLSATEANDSLEWSFDQIADALEQRYLS